jgi:hypothetical protein
MRALPLWQPWRAISTLVGQRIAIYATKTEPPEGGEYWRTAWPFLEYDLDLPVGALIGTVLVAGSFGMTASYCRVMRENEPREHAMGKYEPGRWAFRLEEPRRWASPVPWRGRQGVFMVPDQVAATAECGRCADGLIMVPTGCFNSEPRPCPDCRPAEARDMMRADVFRETGWVL